MALNNIIIISIRTCEEGAKKFTLFVGQQLSKYSNILQGTEQSMLLLITGEFNKSFE